MRSLLLGVDGGGSQTRALATDLTGRVVGQGTGGPSNALAVGWGAALGALRRAVSQALGRGAAAHVEVAVFGLAGVGGPDDRSALRRLHHAFPFARALHVENDAMVALYAGTRGGPGMLINSGTGAIVVGGAPNRPAVRADGWGYLLGDEGSAYEIGVMALRAAMRSFDRRGPPTGLYDVVMAHFREADPWTLVARFSTAAPGVVRSEIASLAVIVEREARRGDSVARSILRSAAARLTRAAVAVLRQVPEARVVLLTGGALAPGSMLSAWLKGALRSKARGIPIRSLGISPVAGAVLMACAHYGADQRQCWQSLRLWWRTQRGEVG